MAHRSADGPTGWGPSDEALRDLVGEERRRRAAAQRRRRASLDQQAMESATLLGVLAAPAARGEHVEVELVDGLRFRGIPCVLGTDVVVLDDVPDRHLVRTGAIAVVRPTGRQVAMGRDPGRARGATCFDELVHAAAADRSIVDVWCGSVPAARGRLRTVGTELVVLDLSPETTDGTDPTARAVVALAHLRAISLRGRRAHSSSALPLSALPTTSG